MKKGSTWWKIDWLVNTEQEISYLASEGIYAKHTSMMKRKIKSNEILYSSDLLLSNILILIEYMEIKCLDHIKRAKFFFK